MSTKAWIIFVAVCVVLFGGLVVWSQKDRADVSKIDTSAIQPARDVSGNIGDHIFGNKDAKVVIIEYGDYQCPGCASLYPNMTTATEKYKDYIAFIFRNFPLTNAHPNARAAAAAAEAAGFEGKYWEMYNLLYENQDEWSGSSTSERASIFKRYAQTIGIDSSKFEETLTDKSSVINQKISFDQALGAKDKVDGTPTVYMNGKKMDSNNFPSAEKLEAAIKAELDAQGVKVADSNE